jgi:hypothetical protein
LARLFGLLPEIAEKTAETLGKSNWHHFRLNAIFEVAVRLFKVISAIRTEQTETGAE